MHVITLILKASLTYLIAALAHGTALFVLGFGPFLHWEWYEKLLFLLLSSWAAPIGTVSHVLREGFGPAPFRLVIAIAIFIGTAATVGAMLFGRGIGWLRRRP